MAARLVLLAGAALALGACQTPLPEVGRLPLSRDAVSASRERFLQDAGEDSVRHVRVPGSSMRARAIKQDVSPALRARPISIRFPGMEATVGDLAQVLASSDIQIAFRWQNEKGADILKRRLPMLSYRGTVGNFLDTMRTGLGVVSWQEGPTIFFSDAERFAISLPQNEDLLKAVTETVKGLGATDVIYSVDGGKVMYSATPALQDEIIGPFLQRTTRNLSTINIQVAIVSLALNDKSGQGFDWSKLGVSLDSRANSIANARSAGQSTATSTATSGTTTGTGTGTTTSTSSLSTSTTTSQNPNPVSGLFPDASTLQKGYASSVSKEDILLGGTAMPTILGVKTAFTVAGAIDWLSTFGNTNVTQNLELRTLSGKQVKFRSGQEIPYVKGVGIGNVGSNGTNVANGVNGSSTNNGLSNGQLGTTQTDKVKTGLTFEMTPRFDSDAELVTVEMKMELKSVLEFVKLSAGNQIGELTQPRTQEQELNDIVRLRAGQTVVVGGLQYDQEQYDGNEPTALRGQLGGVNGAFGRRAQDVQRNALFVILRPVVTVYEPDVPGSSGPLDQLGARVTK